ncbi:clumping factor A-like [Mercenaria mercenaria]|uniref:clumping factor A-like n=1 Tax=Mercenaria mercenaria TaxID=6596 RepID=UPI00234F5806|nr:clumping factor A-like [Mercenaria mercenaria]
MEVNNNQAEARYYEDISSDESMEDRRVVRNVSEKMTEDVSSDSRDSNSDGSDSGSDDKDSSSDDNDSSSDDNDSSSDGGVSRSEECVSVGDENEIDEEKKEKNDGVCVKDKEEKREKVSYEDETESGNEEMEFEIHADDLDELYSRLYQRDMSDEEGKEEDKVENNGKKLNEDDWCENETDDIMIADETEQDIDDNIVINRDIKSDFNDKEDKIAENDCEESVEMTNEKSDEDIVVNDDEISREEYIESDPDDIQILNVDTTENIKRVVVMQSITAQTVYTYRNDEVIHIERFLITDEWFYSEN